MQKLKIKSLRVMVWVRPETRKKLLTLKVKEGHKSLDSMICEKLFK